jgi:16S rRNA (guanine527-N7)-methyltransferase
VTGDFRARLLERLELASFTPGPDLVERLQAYYELLAIWNQKINLSGMDLTEPTAGALDRLLVEPVVASRHAAPGSRDIIDIGSGGGSPAIPFALAVPRPRLVMVESKVRKSVFLKEALRVVGMHDSEVITARFEDVAARAQFAETHDILTVRAVRVERAELNILQKFVRRGGQLFLFRRAAELVPAAEGLEASGTYPLVFSLESQLVVMKKSG